MCSKNLLVRRGQKIKLTTPFWVSASIKTIFIVLLSQSCVSKGTHSLFDNGPARTWSGAPGSTAPTPEVDVESAAQRDHACPSERRRRSDRLSEMTMRSG